MRTQTTTHRTRFARGLGLGVVLTGLLASSVSAAATQVSVDDTDTFGPSLVQPAVGGSVHWAATGTDAHSVTQDARLFDSGLGQVDFTRTFSAGTFGYHCLEHGVNGGNMRGTVRVAPLVQAGPAGLPFAVTWATPSSNTGTRFDVQYKVGAGAWRNWLTNSTARGRVFGARSTPVRVARGRTYSFRVVSETATARSLVSPARTFPVR